MAWRGAERVSWAMGGGGGGPGGRHRAITALRGQAPRAIRCRAVRELCSAILSSEAVLRKNGGIQLLSLLPFQAFNFLRY